MLVEFTARGLHPFILDVEGGERVADVRERLVRDSGVSARAKFVVGGRTLDDDDILVPASTPVPTSPAALLAQYPVSTDPLGGIGLMRVALREE